MSYPPRLQKTRKNLEITANTKDFAGNSKTPAVNPREFLVMLSFPQ